MERYELQTLYNSYTAFVENIYAFISNDDIRYYNMLFGKTIDDYYTTLLFVLTSIYNEYFSDYVAYMGSDESEVKTIFQTRLVNDILIKLPYWDVKYNYIKKLFTDSELTLLMQSSKMLSSSSEDVNSTGGSLQKTASTPTGVSTTLNGDDITLVLNDSDNSLITNTSSNSYVDKYTNYQGKTNTASKTKGSRTGEISRQGSIDELLNILEKLPSSFANEINKEVAKHFIFVY